jgi:hypothetical protein
MIYRVFRSNGEVPTSPPIASCSIEANAIKAFDATETIFEDDSLRDGVIVVDGDGRVIKRKGVKLCDVPLNASAFRITASLYLDERYDGTIRAVIFAPLYVNKVNILRNGWSTDYPYSRLFDEVACEIASRYP